MRKIGILVNWALSFLGFKILRLRSLEPGHSQIIKTSNVDLVIDVGANKGQYASALFKQGYVGDILSFEASSSVYDRLILEASSNARWRVNRRAALGASPGTVSFNIAGNEGLSSSVLQMGATHLASVPDSQYIATETVEMTTLAHEMSSDIKSYKRVFLKLDVQGYEKEVLAGALPILPYIFGVQIELSTTSLYEGDETFEYFFEFFERKGFELWDVQSGHRHTKTRRLLQFDAVFIKSGSAASISRKM